MILKTKRLEIHLATEKEIQELIDKTKIDELKEAYKEMLNGALSNPKEREFYAMWFISSLKGEHIGELCFKGIKNGETEIGYGISEKFQHNGYGTESVDALTSWALKQKKVERVFAEVEKNNVYSIRLLKKIGFVKTETQRGENLIFEKKVIK